MNKMDDICDKRNVDDMMLLCSEYMEVWRNYFVFVSLYENIILLVNSSNYIIEKVIVINGTESKFNQFRYFTVYNNDVILVPFSSTEFIKINLENEKQTHIKNVCEFEKQTVSGKFLMGIKVDNYLWCVGQGIHSVICLDLDNDMKKVADYAFDADIAWSDAYVIEGGYIYIPSMNKNRIMIIDCFKQKSCVKDIEGNNGGEGILDIAVFNNRIYLFDREGKPYLLQSQDDAVLIKQLLDEKHFLSRQSFTYKDNIYRVGLYENCIFEENLNSGVSKKIYFKTITNCCGTHAHHGCIIENFFYFQTRYGQFFKLNLETSLCEEIIIKTNAQYEEMQKVFWKKRLENEIIFEECYVGAFGLKEYIKEIGNI